MISENLNLFGTILSYSTVKYMAIHIVLLFLLLALNAKEVINYIRSKKIHKSTIKILFIVFLISLLLRLSFGNYYSPSGEMEWEFKSNAKYMLEGKQIHLGRHTQGYSYLVSIVFFLFGINSNLLFLFNVIIGAITPLMIFFLAYVLFNDKYVALISSLFFAVFPKHILYSRTGGSETLSIFLVTLYLIFLWIAPRIDRASFYSLTVVVLTLAAEVRMENLALIILFFATILMKICQQVPRIKFNRTVVSIIIFIITALPISYWYFYEKDILYSIELILPGKQFDFSNTQYDYIKADALSNVIIYLNNFFDIFNHGFIPFFVILSLLWLRRFYSSLIFLMAFLVLNLFIYGLFYSPNSFRYIIFSYPGMIILGSFGIIQAVRFGFKSKVKSNVVIALVIIISVIITVPQIYKLNHKTGIYGDVIEYLILNNNITDEATFVCCNWQEVCEFLMPNRDVLQKIDFNEIKERLRNNVTTIYLKSPVEKAIGCGEDNQKKLVNVFDITFIKKIRLIELYKISEK